LWGARAGAVAAGRAAAAGAGVAAAGFATWTTGNGSGRSRESSAETAIALASTSVGMQKDRSTVFPIWARTLINFARPVKRFRAIKNNRRISRTGRGDELPVKIVVVANHLSSLHGNLEQGWFRRLDSALGVDFRGLTFCAGQRSVSLNLESFLGKTSGSHERSFRDSVRPSHATGRLERRRH